MEQANANQAQESDLGNELKPWQRALLALGVIAAFVGSILNGVAYALGATLASGVVYYIAIRAGQELYSRVEALRLGVIPYHVYKKGCLGAGVLSIPMAFLLQSPGNGAFLFFYAIFGVLALLIYGVLFPVVSRVR